ncbi:hypothetical protein Tco_1421244 [Tanacetum coccineum]
MIASNSSRYSSNDMVHNHYVPTGKIFTSSTTKVGSEPLNGSNEDITNQYEYEQTLDVSAGTLNLSAGISQMIQPEPNGSTQGHSIVRNSSPYVRLEMNEFKGIMLTKIELTLEQSQQGVSNDVLVSIEGVEE